MTFIQKTSVTGCDRTHFREIKIPASQTDNCIANCNARQSCLRRLENQRLTDSDGSSPYGQSVICLRYIEKRKRSL